MRTNMRQSSVFLFIIFEIALSRVSEIELADNLFDDVEDGTPSIRVLSPLQGSYNGQSVEFSWAVKNYVVDPSGSAHQAIIYVNGIKAHQSAELEGRVSFQDLSDGSYRVDAMLATYDEDDGLTSVLSAHTVEFFVGEFQPLPEPPRHR
jgi:hypothetical protein